MLTSNTFRFLDELAANNNKTWFEANKKNYELLVREPALDFIGEMAPLLFTFAPSFRAEPRKIAGIADAGIPRYPFLPRQNAL